MITYEVNPETGNKEIVATILKRKFGMEPIGIVFLIVAIAFSALFVYPGWPDQDGYATFNYICGAEGLNPPPVFGFITRLIPCDVRIAKVFQSLLIFAFFFVVQYFFPKKHLLVGYIPLLIVFFFTLEDDLMALPIMAALFWFAIRGKIDTLSYGFLTLFIIPNLIWKGAFLVGLITTAYLVYPWLSFIPIIVYLWPLVGPFDNWGGAGEAIPFFASYWVVLPLLGALFGLLRLDKEFFTRRLVVLSFAFGFLSLLQPKWAEWMVLPVLPLLSQLYDYVEEPFRRIMLAIGLILILMMVGITITNQTPTPREWELMSYAVAIQKGGEDVYNHWSLGHHIEYLGGKPSAKGGSSGDADQFDITGYWIGTARKNCRTIDSTGNLYLQKC